MASELQPTLETLAGQPSIAALAQQIAQPGGRVHAAPALTAARPPLLAALAQQVAPPLLYLVQNTDLALRAR
ncbi:hypothetical protein SE17_21360, partial [Kouleothrix aurantiaca]